MYDNKYSGTLHESTKKLIHSMLLILEYVKDYTKTQSQESEEKFNLQVKIHEGLLKEADRIHTKYLKEMKKLHTQAVKEKGYY